MTFKKALVFIKRDFILLASYRFSFFLQLFGIFFSVLTFYFISKMFEGVAIPSLEQYGGNYFSFVLIGIAFTTYMWTGLGSFSGNIREEQMMGTLEAMMVTSTGVSRIILFSSLWDFIFTSIRAVIYLLVGIFLFNIDMGNANLFAALIVLILTVVCFSSMGIISASLIMIFKQGDPVSSIFSTASGFLGGVFYPIAILPGWLQNLSYILPITYSLRAMRHALLQGYSLEALSTDIFALIIFSIIMLPLSMLSFRYAIRRVKVDGSLTQY